MTALKRIEELDLLEEELKQQKNSLEHKMAEIESMLDVLNNRKSH